MDTENFKLDIGHIWIPLKKAQKMLALENEVTYVSYAIGEKKIKNSGILDSSRCRLSDTRY